MERLLIIGAAGGLGSKLMELGKGRFEMFGTYNNRKLSGKNLFLLDAANKADVEHVIEKVRPHFVVDAHSLTNLDYCELNQKEAWRVNVEGSKNMAQLCKKQECKYAFLSTDNVFDGKKKSYTEQDGTNPLNYYAKTKVEVESALEALDMDYIVARTSVLYGTGGLGKTSFVSWAIEKLESGKRIRVVCDQFNNPTLTDSLSQMLFGLYEKDARGIFHTTGGECISRYDFSLQIAKLFDLDSGLIKSIDTEQLKQVALRAKNLNMVTDKVKKTTGISPLSVLEGLKILKAQLGK